LDIVTNLNPANSFVHHRVSTESIFDQMKKAEKSETAVSKADFAKRSFRRFANPDM